MDLHDSFNAADLRLDSCVAPDDIFAFCGVCQLHLEEWPNPVLVAFAYDQTESDELASDDGEDHAALQARLNEVLTKLRKGLEKIGLTELACYDQSPPGYALVAQLANQKHDLKKAAGELTKLVWSLAE